MAELVDPKHRSFIIKKIRSLLPSAEIMVFGSRVRGDAKRYSDLDIALDDSGAISLQIMAQIEEGISQSDIPYKVDFLDFYKTDVDFQTLIRKNSISW